MNPHQRNSSKQKLGMPRGKNISISKSLVTTKRLKSAGGSSNGRRTPLEKAKCRGKAGIKDFTSKMLSSRSLQDEIPLNGLFLGKAAARNPLKMIINKPEDLFLESKQDLKNRSHSNTPKLDFVVENKKKKDSFKVREYKIIAPSLKKLELIPWEYLDPENNQNSPLCNPPRTPFAMWFLLCSSYFKREILSKSWDQIEQGLKTQLESLPNPTPIHININLLRKDIGLQTSLGFPHNLRDHIEARFNKTQFDKSKIFNLRELGFLDGSFKSSEYFVKRYNLDHDIFINQMRLLLLSEYEKLNPDIERSSDTLALLNGVNLDILIKLLMINHKSVSSSIFEKIQSIKQQFENEKECEKQFCEATNLEEVSCDLACILPEEKEYLKLLQRELSGFKLSKNSAKTILFRKCYSKTDIPNEAYVCQICEEGDYQEDNLIVFCSKCSITVHQKCYGLYSLPKVEWLCELCSSFQEKGRLVSCFLCTRRGGALRKANFTRKCNLIKKLNPMYSKAKLVKYDNRASKVQISKRTISATNESFDSSKRDSIQMNRQFEANLYYNYFRQSEVFKNAEISEEPHSDMAWAHLSCAYWVPGMHFVSLESQLEEHNSKKTFTPHITGTQTINIGLESVDPERFCYPCDVCGQTEAGAIVQCPESNCTASYHAECARRANIRLTFRYSTFPYWRIYCNLHAELPLKNILKQNAVLRSFEIFRFCRGIDKFHQSFGEDEAITNVQKSKTSIRTSTKQQDQKANLKLHYLKEYLLNEKRRNDIVWILKKVNDHYEFLEYCSISELEAGSVHEQSVQMFKEETLTSLSSNLKKRSPTFIVDESTSGKPQKRLGSSPSCMKRFDGHPGGSNSLAFQELMSKEKGV